MAHINVDEVVHDRFKAFADSGSLIGATMKAFPEDFEVTEIDELTGTAVKTNGIVPDGDSCFQIDQDRLCRLIETGASALSVKASKVAPISNEEVVPETQSIESIIDATSLKNIETFNDNVKGGLFDRSSSTPVEDMLINVKLKFVPNKANRMSVYTHMRNAYPLLHATLSSGTDMVVKPNIKVMAMHSVVRLPEEDVMKFASLLTEERDGNESHIHIGKNLDRSSRTLFYQAISCDFQHLEARTIKVGEDQVIDLRFRRSSKKRKVRCDESSGNAEACLPSSAKETITLHLAFTLLKQDTDHASAIEAVAAALQLPSTAITYAGMKDRRAITAQRVVASLSVPLVRASTSAVTSSEIKYCASVCENLLTDAVSKLKSLATSDLFCADPALRCRQEKREDSDYLPRAVMAMNFAIMDRPMFLGGAGNKFRIYLRDMARDTFPQLESNLQQVFTTGYPNYFGSQRFSSSPPRSGNEEMEMPVSPRLGQLLLSEEYLSILPCMLAHLVAKNESSYQTAYSSIMSPMSSYAEVLRSMPDGRHTSVEKQFLRNLIRHGAKRGPLADKRENANNARAHGHAVKKISHFHRTIWVTAYQSWLWNQAVCRRLHSRGMAPVPGDLILCQDSSVKVVAETDISSCNEEQLQLMALSVVYPMFGGGSSMQMPVHPEGKCYAETVSCIRDGFAQKLPRGGYRTILAKVIDPTVIKVTKSACELTFQLPPGSFATSLIAYVCRNSSMY
jgi:TruD family tRNA pseudouridine synthase